MISGSWDRTARVWSRASSGSDAREEEDGQGWKCEIVMEEHEEAVWGVLAIDTGPSEGCWLTSSGSSFSTPVTYSRSAANLNSG